VAELATTSPQDAKQEQPAEPVPESSQRDDGQPASNPGQAQVLIAAKPTSPPADQALLEDNGHSRQQQPSASIKIEPKPYQPGREE